MDHRGMTSRMTRRRFLHSAAVTGGALWIGVPAVAGDAVQRQTLAGWVRVDTDGVVTLLVNATEMGQGAQSAFAQILADELELDWSQVRIDFAPVEPAYYGMWETYQTGGSGSVRGMFDRLRIAGATARECLLRAAAQRWNVPASECRTGSGAIHHDPSGRHAAYGQLAAQAARIAPPADIVPKPREQWTFIGRAVPRLDIREKVDGRAVFGIDVQQPGMLCAAIAQCPTFGGKLRSVDPSPALAAAHVVQVVKLDNAVSVVARDFWSARRALEKLQPVWDHGGNAELGSAELSRQLHAAVGQEGKAFLQEGEDEHELRAACDSAFSASSHVIERVYEAPLLSHSPMEPMNATALVRADRATLWVPTQVQSDMKAAVAKRLGIPAANVTIHTTFVGGGFGRRLQTDYGEQAALIAREVGKPVKMLWTREEDTQHGFYRPAAVVRLRAAIVGADIAAVRAHIGCLDPYTPVGGLVGQPYALPNFLITYAGSNPGVPLGAWRSVDASQNLFFLESFIDELAGELRQDPLNFRRQLLKGQPRALRVLDAAAKLAHWDEPLPEGRGRGIALLKGFGSLTAQVAEVSVDADRNLRVHRVACVVDCGMAVNPDSVRAQFEGGVVFALSAAAFGEITIEHGRVQQANFDTCPVVRMNQCPQIDVEILESPGEKIGGVGEPPVPPVAPAIANAIFAATGERLRRLPFSSHGMKLGALRT
jgi:isoquinoline 1-oxidoreductase beta subunit